MELLSLKYLLFVLILLILYYGLPLLRSSVRKYQWMVLLAGSLGYYAMQDVRHILFLLLTSFTVWAGADRIGKIQEVYKTEKKAAGLTREEKKALKKLYDTKSRRVLFGVLFLNFGILAYLKYWVVLLNVLRGGGAASLILPLGISFYTFQATSYILDVHGSKYGPEKNYAKFLLFVSYFPQLLQGPIGRYPQIGNQLTEQRAFDRKTAGEGVLLILYGLMKKYAVADMLAPLIAEVLDGPVDGIPGSMLAFIILLYSAQQYADFSGGIDIISGVSLLFGVRLAPNFRQPYFATSLGDFWRRWHISLGAWMRDYVFYPFALTKPMQELGKKIIAAGNYEEKAKKERAKHLGRVIPAAIANILVFFLVGIWHGAELHYVLWGLYNGIVIALSDILEPVWKIPGSTSAEKGAAVNTERVLSHVLRVFRTFLIVNIGWYFDRITDVHKCWDSLKATFFRFAPYAFSASFRQELLTTRDAFTVYGSLALAMICVMAVFVISVLRERGKEPELYLMKHPAVYAFSAFVMVTLTTASFLFAESAGGFMYANF